MSWIGKLMLGGLFMTMATMTVSAYALMDGEKRHETVLIKNQTAVARDAGIDLTMADEAELCLMSDQLNCLWQGDRKSANARSVTN
ncbi:MAG: hypothetical protein DHS20C08_06820 [Rhodomicrobium sp.]|nr:MAG: hypothetical protein DHS20C08_06820 [Rhodomicrobium sp.]